MLESVPSRPWPAFSPNTSIVYVRSLKHLLPLFGLLLWTSCATPSESQEISLEGWPSETIVLPPPFAPELPRGKESLLFAPGFRDRESDGFWSYAFAVWMDGPPPDAAGLEAWFESYYDGLMNAVATGDGKDIGDDPAQVQVVATSANTFQVSIHLLDAFGNLEPVDLRAHVTSESTERTILRLQVSPQPEGHSIWNALAVAAASIREP